MGSEVQAEALPRVTPYLLRRADSMCPRRLARTFGGAESSHDPVHRSRLRDAFLAAARDAHAAPRRPRRTDFAGAGPALEAEERAVLEQAAAWYVHVFGDRVSRVEDLRLDSPTPSPRRGLRIGGWVDLAVVNADGTKELRQLDLWNGTRAPGPDPLAIEAVRVAVLRVAAWAGDGPLRVVWADLVWGEARDRVVDLSVEKDALRDWFDERVRALRVRVADPVAVNGDDCRTCTYVAACPEHPTGAHFGNRRDFLPGIVPVTPTSLEAWHRCTREWRDAYVLSIPSSDVAKGTAHGEQVHDLLRLVHQSGSCHDDRHVQAVLEANGFDGNARLEAELANHVRRCPASATSVGHEVTRARFHRKPLPPFMASARFDALWEHHGILDARDYKTGRVWSESLATDRQARLQAWVLAPLAAARGLRLRITFEHLSPETVDDPDPFEPEADDLEAIEEELRAAVAAMRAEEEFAGVADPDTCQPCRYRSICPASAAPGAPVWPVVEPDPGDDADPGEGPRADR
jgi:hypothetical protein